MGSVRIATPLEERIRRIAARKGITRSELFRQALEAYCDQEERPATSRFDDVIGVVDVPGANSEQVSEVFGEVLKEKARTGRL